MWLQRGESSKKWDHWGESTLILKGIMGGSSLFFTVVCASLFGYHIPVFFIVFLSFVPVLSIVTIAETL